MKNYKNKYIILMFISLLIVVLFYNKSEFGIGKSVDGIKETKVKNTQDSKIILEEYKKNDAIYWIATVKNKTNNNIIKAGFGEDKYKGEKETVESFAKRHNAILAINGSGVDKEGNFFGKVIRNRKLYQDKSRYTSRPTLLALENGKMIFADSNENGTDLIEQGAVESFSFGVELVKDGIKINESDIESRLNEKHPRTALGQSSNGDYIILVADGRSENSKGLTPIEVANIMEEKECVNAIMLDGGGSSTLYFDGKIINNPSDGTLRKVPEIIYFN